MNYNYYDFCPVPFSEMEIHNDGNVYVCCPNWNNCYSIGNIYKDTLKNVFYRVIILYAEVISATCCMIKIFILNLK